MRRTGRTTVGLAAALLLGCSACVIDTTGGAQCTPAGNCVTNPDGTVECEVGFRWENEADTSNFNCVEDNPLMADGGTAT